ncbi:MAG: peptidoglycan DD-metalloendopeptidase family protein [Hyphomicrobiales bacterium]|nr:peptidoglycan DD-metalloendopeptidase family protein [Hyphomicrobiales bacterium]
MPQRLNRAGKVSLLAVAFVASLAAACGARADSAPPNPPEASDQQRADTETELRGVEDTLHQSDEQRRAIESEIDSVRTDRARLSAALIDTTSQVQDAERGAAAAADRLTSLNATADELSHSLERRRGVIADVLAALQRMGSNPPPAILVKPDDMSEAVRAAAVMGSLIPELKSEIEAARRDLDDLAKTRESIARERDALTEKGKALAAEKMRLAALIEARQQSLASAQDALGSQQQRAADLAKKAGSLKDLIARLDSESAARQAAALAAHESEVAQANEIEARAQAAQGAETPRLKPEIAFADAKGRVPLPAAGAILKTFGSPDDLGGVERGVSLATPAGATVSTPVDGAVLFAGAYRTYGKLLIIDAGGGYYVLLAGLDRINVQSGESVLAGEPVGVMGDGSTRMATAAAVGAARPVLYIELRKDGTAIDPGPWWAKTDIEKARG